MSLKYSYTTADYLAWNEMTGLIRRLYADGNYTISLLLACGSFWWLLVVSAFFSLSPFTKH